MEHVKNDMQYLKRIIADLKFVIDQTADKKQNDIEENPLLLDSILFRIIQIAENNNKLTEEFKQKNNQVPWLAIKGMRNKIVHNYGEINLKIVYDTVTRGIPEMYEKLIEIED